jgi:hypothetical protein
VGPDIDLDALLVTSGLSDSDQYLDFVVSNSENQDGTYSMTRNGQGAIPFEFILEQPIPLHRAQGGLPQFFDVAIGLHTVRFSSTDTTLDTQMRINDAPAGAVPNNTAHDKFFSGTAPFVAAGTTKYFQLPEDPKSLSVDDELQLYLTDASTPDSSHVLTALELSQLLIEVSPEIATDLGTVVMSAVTPAPFAKIRLHKKHNYSVLESGLDNWLDLPQAQEAWFTELYRLINPLVTDKNPALADVTTAKLYVQAMDDALVALDAVLDVYVVDPVEAVDTLIESYEQRGATRGIDVLLQGRFSAFFNISLEGMSYAGRMRELLREIAAKDLPVSSVGRENRMDTEMTEAEYEDVDFDFDLSDVEGLGDDIDIPGDYTDLITIGR